MMQHKKQQVIQEAELRCYQTTEEEQNKWEVNEIRLVKEISDLKDNWKSKH